SAVIYPALPDLDVTSITTLSAPTLISATPFELSVGLQITNLGGTNSAACKGRLLMDGVLKRTFDIGAISRFEGVTSVSLPSFGTTGGSHQVTVEIDSTSTIAEALENNNSQNKTISVP